MSKLQQFESKYNFINTTPTKFEINNPNISLLVFDENNKKIYITKNNSANKAQIVQLKNNRYASLKPIKNKFIKLDKMLTFFSHKESKEHMLKRIITNDFDDTNK